MITFDEKTGFFYLEARDSSYVFQVLPDATLCHYYWGKKLMRRDISHLRRIYERSFSPNLYGAADRTVSPDTLPGEYPCFGRGDYHSPAFMVKTPEGDRLCELTYKSHSITDGKPSLAGLPSLRAKEGEAQTLTLVLEDTVWNLEVRLFYTVFEELDVITRHTEICNRSGKPLQILQAASASVDFSEAEYEMISLPGSYARERGVERLPLRHGLNIVESRRGASSAQMNPFAALVRPSTTENTGEVWAAALVYSGNFRISAERDQFDTTRLQIGINPFDFAWLLESGEEFVTPEAIFVYSDKGLNGMSQNFHEVYRKHLSKSRYVNAPRPIVINSWEAVYFDMNEGKMKELVQSAAGLGIDMFVLDDGWFGHRDDDTTSLGDWTVDKRKFPNGLKPVIDTCHACGMKFGLWFEPEMISPDSDLYRAHPDWCIHVDGRMPLTSRAQWVLDLSRAEVRAYVEKAVCDILSSNDISYVKWDMNRHITDWGSAGLPANRQSEQAHRYIIGLYEMLEHITSRFPEVLFEGCSGGGGRFDFGMLFYMPQTWTSDNSDACGRLEIQYGTSLVYPPSSMAGHVSVCPNHQVGRITPFETRGDVAMCCSFGYELNPGKLSEEEREQVRLQTARYRSIQSLVLEGDFYRIRSPFTGNDCCFQMVSKDKNDSLVVYVQKLAMANPVLPRIYLSGLNPEVLYQAEETGEIYGGDELMYAGLTLPMIQGDFVSVTYTFHVVPDINP